VNTHILELGAPVQITVAYAGQTPVPKPFLMIVDWVRTPEGWRMATDIALPIPRHRPRASEIQPGDKACLKRTRRL
jgi:hypothetical protein